METINLKPILIAGLAFLSSWLLWLFFRSPDRRVGYSLVVGGAIANIAIARIFWSNGGRVPWTAVEVIVVGFLVLILLSLYSDIQTSPIQTSPPFLRKEAQLYKPTKVLLFLLYGGGFLAALLVLLSHDRIPLTFWTGFFLILAGMGAMFGWGIGLIQRRRRRP